MSLSSGEHDGKVGNGKYVIEEIDNPFQSDGELSRKADYIVRHSRISRTEIQIADPDTAPFGNTAAVGNVLTTAGDGDTAHCTVHTSISKTKTQSMTTSETMAETTSNTTTITTTSEKQKKTETSIHPTMEVRVTSGIVDAGPEPSSAETVKIKSKKCVVM